MDLESAFRLPRLVGPPRRSTVLALGLLGGGLVLACIPGTHAAFTCWGLGSWLTLACGVVWHVGRAAWFAVCARVRASVLEAWQAVVLVFAAVLFVPMIRLCDTADFAARCLELRAQALAMPDDGGPRFAWREGGDVTGYGKYGLAYDASGQILRPAWLRSPQWIRRVEGTVFAGKCWSAQQIVGPFYRWDGNGCH